MVESGGDRCRWIEHKGIKILFTDFRDVPVEGYFPILDQAIAMVRKEGPHSVFTLSAHSHIHINKPLTVKTDEFKNAAEGISRGAATFGLEGVQRVIAKSVKRDIYFAANMEESLAWIEEQNKK